MKRTNICIIWLKADTINEAVTPACQSIYSDAAVTILRVQRNNKINISAEAERNTRILICNIKVEAN